MPRQITTITEALRWALHRIETAGLGQGEYFEQADRLLSEHERTEKPELARSAVEVRDADPAAHTGFAHY